MGCVIRDEDEVISLLMQTWVAPHAVVHAVATFVRDFQFDCSCAGRKLDVDGNDSCQWALKERRTIRGDSVFHVLTDDVVTDRAKSSDARRDVIRNSGSGVGK